MLVASLLFASDAQAKQVHVYQQTSAGGTVTQLSDQVLETGSSYSTQTAPAKSGYIFTHWSIAQTQGLNNRDRHGRAKEVATYTLYEETTLTANYLPTSQDSDVDGVADGYEIYWYGTTDVRPDSDTDGDGYTFAEELAAGTNPLLGEDSSFGAVVWDEGELLLYNPENLAPYVIRSEPEGKLFSTQTDYAKPGTVKYSPSVSKANGFAYWTLNGVRQSDRNGRARDSVSFTMTGEAVELVAVCVDDATQRELAYWYDLDAGVDANSDTDQDGYTFAEEVAAGTNPILAEESTFGSVVWDEGELLEYNPELLHPYVIRSEPEGKLFTTLTAIVKPGTVLPIPTVSHANSTFAYWTVNGVRQQDRNGRAKDSISVTMPVGNVEVVAVCIDDATERELAYWYGANSGLGVESDTDGDGYTFAEELAAGTNPILMEDSTFGAVVWDDGETLEANLQPYEQLQGAVVGGKFTELFTSPTAGNGATSEAFGANLQPVVADVNGDELWDLVLVSDSGVKVLVNVGAKGNPEFEERVIDVSAVDLKMNSTEKLDTLDLDTPVIGALSATVWGEALLASDTEGRIWFYISQTPQTTQTFALQHKVWGGSHPGFANGLRLAAVDWDDDGDLDCLCGTAEGKLMLLRDPKVGRPTNLKALVGVDNVKLDWDPNQQSRIRGYKVYRADAGGEDFTSLISPYTPLPTYRDYPPSVSDFDYKVSSVSRHYVAGNSTPIESESPATEVVRASLGKVKFFWNDAVAKQGERAEVLLSIENSLNYDVAGKTQVVTFDPAHLVPLKIIKTGLTENVSYEESVIDGKWTITLKSGNLAAGGGKFFTLVFDTLKAGTTKVGEATVTIVARQEPALYRLGDVTGDGVVDILDLRELARLKSVAGRKWTANQLKAGDFNGNGKLDEADYQALWDLLKEKGLL